MGIWLLFSALLGVVSDDVDGLRNPLFLRLRAGCCGR